jgi:dTDP-glucose 4,6-dehydratase/UDP-glucuronate decarboxylase
MNHALHPIVREDIEEIVTDIGDKAAALEGCTVVVTGGFGFLGSYLIDTLAAINDRSRGRPCRIVCLDNAIVNDDSNLAHLQDRDDVRFVRHDVSTPIDLDGPVDYIIHAASIASPLFYQKYPLETIAVNVDGTRNVLELARQKETRGVLYLSTSEVYGDPDPTKVPTPESYQGNVSCVGPRAPYDESKRLGESLCTVYARKFGVPVNITRTFNSYGPRLRLSDPRVVSNFFRCALSGETLGIYDATSTRSYCYVSDNIRAQFLVLLSGLRDEIFNVGNNEEEVTVRELANRINNLFGGTLRIAHLTPNDPVYVTDNPKRRCPDVTRIRTTLGWRHAVSMDDGLRRMLVWARDQHHAAVPD